MMTREEGRKGTGKERKEGKVGSDDKKQNKKKRKWNKEKEKWMREKNK